MMDTKLFNRVSVPLARLEEGLAIAMDSAEEPVQGINRHLLHAPGKRIRPALFFLALQQLQESPEAYLDVALAIELIHTASLVHDDVVDRSQRRRSQPTVNYLWGNHTAVLAGDYLFAKAFRLLSDFGSIQVIREMASLVENMSEGEIQQQSELFCTDLTQEQYLQRITKKTARFFSTCTRCAALVSRSDEQTLTALADFGFNFGIAFQLTDDLLDFYGDEATTGKPVAGDLRQGILTLPVLHLLDISSRRRELAEKISSGVIDDALITDIKQQLGEYHCDSYVRKLAAHYVNKAVLALGYFPFSESRELLSQVSNLIIDRVL